MTTLEEAIAPDRFEVVSTFPIGLREWTLDRDTALAIARKMCTPRVSCVQICAYGTKGNDRDHGFALRNFEWHSNLPGGVLDSGWRCWLGAGQFIGEVD